MRLNRNIPDTTRPMELKTIGRNRKFINVLLAGAVLLVTALMFRQLYLPPSSVAKLVSQYKYINPKSGYRMGHYRAPTPPGISGATRVSTLELKKLIEKPDVLLIDVMAHTGAGWDPLSGEWLVSKPRFDIPGSVWLPDVGAGFLSNELERYFKSNMKRLTNGDKSRPLVVYCQSDCWMSWNAVRRLLSWGYKNISWYPEGSDGWVEANQKLVRASAVALDIQ